MNDLKLLLATLLVGFLAVVMFGVCVGLAVTACAFMLDEHPDWFAGNPTDEGIGQDYAVLLGGGIGIVVGLIVAIGSILRFWKSIAHSLGIAE